MYLYFTSELTNILARNEITNAKLVNKDGKSVTLNYVPHKERSVTMLRNKQSYRMDSSD